MLQIRTLYQARRALVTAVPRKKAPFVQPYQSSEEILQSEGVQEVLREGNLSVTDELENENGGEKATKVALLAHLSQSYSEPVPSNVLNKMNTATDIADWFSDRLRPIGALPHTRNFIQGALLKENATEEDVKILEDRIALEREAVHNEFMGKLPPNLSLSAKTFKEPAPIGLKIKVSPYKKQRFMRRKEGSSEPDSA